MTMDENTIFVLGKQTEAVTQEEIEKAAKDYAYNVGGSDWERLIIRDAFVDGANFTLGKHEKDAEVDRTLKVNRQLFCRLCADADDYINEHLEEDDSDYVYYQGRSDALHELYRGECKDAEGTVIQGWVAKNNNIDGVYLYNSMPERGINVWYGYISLLILHDSNLFPDLTWESEPIKVSILIKRE